jgi:hypothetical protein
VARAWLLFDVLQSLESVFVDIRTSLYSARQIPQEKMLWDGGEKVPSIVGLSSSDRKPLPPNPLQ